MMLRESTGTHAYDLPELEKEEGRVRIWNNEVKSPF